MKSEKNVISAGDVVLIYQNNLPVDFAHIASVQPDTRKKDFWIVEFLKIGFPSMAWAWLLDTEQLSEGPFTMNSIPMRLQLYSRATNVKKETKNEKLDDLLKDVTPENINRDDSLF